MPMPMRMAGFFAAACSWLKSSIKLDHLARREDRALRRLVQRQGRAEDRHQPSPTIWFTTPPWPVIASNISV
jgi:hypothetical protein